MYPEGVITRKIVVGPATDLASGKPTAIRVMVEPSRRLIWGAAPVVPALKTYNIPANVAGEIELPVTDQSGYKDANGNTIVLDPGDHAFFYNITVYYLIGGSVVSKDDPIKVLLPSGVGNLDIDLMIKFDNSLIGEGVSVPDSWSELVTAAQVAAAQAAASAAAAQEAVADIVGDFVQFESSDTSILEMKLRVNPTTKDVELVLVTP